MPLEIPGGILTDENYDGFVSIAKAALLHMVERGEVPAFVGKPMTAEKAAEYLKSWLGRNRGTLMEGGFDYLAGLAKKIAVGEDDQPLEEFEASLASLTDEQIVALNALEADRVAEMKADVIDRRRELLADLLAVGKELLRGAVATGLHAIMAEVGGGGLSSVFGDGGGNGQAA